MQNLVGARRRSAPDGVTLLEVLISMGVLTIGILGVAALFPVGNHLAMRGEVYDRADAAAAAALNDAVSQGLLDPERWVAHNNHPNPNLGVFSIPFAASYRNGLRLEQRILKQNSPNYTEAHSAQNLHRRFGSVFVIDPVGVSSSITINKNTPVWQYKAKLQASFVPASTGQRGLTALNQIAALRSDSASWFPWQNGYPIRRVTIANPFSPGVPVSASQAERLGNIQDDLAQEFDLGPDQPAQQLMYRTTAGVTKRQAKEHFNWMITIAPTTPEGLSALAYGGRDNVYDVSAVVFNRRALGGGLR